MWRPICSHPLPPNPLLTNICRSKKSFIEPVEETRLATLTLLSNILSAIQNHGNIGPSLLLPFVPAFAAAISSSLCDSFPNARLTASKLLPLFMYTLSTHRINDSDMGKGYYEDDGFYEASPLCEYSEPILTAITSAIKMKGHQVTRCYLYTSLLFIVIGGAHKVSADWIGHVTNGIEDFSPLVRKSVVNIAGRMLLALPNWRDVCAELLSVIMIGLSDDVEEVRNEAIKIIDSVGSRYEELFPDICKDKARHGEELYLKKLENLNFSNVTCISSLSSSSFVFCRSFINSLLDYFGSFTNTVDDSTLVSVSKGLISTVLIGEELVIGRLPKLIPSLIVYLKNSSNDGKRSVIDCVGLIGKVTDSKSFALSLNTLPESLICIKETFEFLAVFLNTLVIPSMDHVETLLNSLLNYTLLISSFLLELMMLMLRALLTCLKYWR
ncbi:hypothetical protein GEMRC1_012260 [Eukaryota sp. GEM-RC1]